MSELESARLVALDSVRRAIAAIEELRSIYADDVEPDRYAVYLRLAVALESVDVESMRELHGQLVALNHGPVSMGFDQHEPRADVRTYLKSLDATQSEHQTGVVLSAADTATEFGVTTDTIANWATGRTSAPPNVRIRRERRGYYRVWRF